MQATAEQLTEAHFEKFRKIIPGSTTPEQVHWSELHVWGCEFEGHHVHIDVYYTNDGKIPRGTPIEGLRFHVTVWHPECTIRSENGTTEDLDKLMDVVRETAKKVDELCTHDNAVEVSAAEAREHGVEHWGMCWHVYHCPDCDSYYGIDSSD